MKKLLTFSFLLFPLLATAQSLEPANATPPVYKAPAEQNNDTDEPDGFSPAGPEINIITEGDKTIEEYSLNGRIYMVKIQQKGFAPYYLIDRNGDGRMDEQVSELMGPATTPPNWVLFRW
jgi:hypothetical protein